MSYKLKAGETLDEGLRRVVVAQIDEAIAGLTRGPRLAAVHHARTSVKKIRAALRLARAALGRRTFGRENAAFRDIGRLLSAVRDADVLVESLDKIKPELGAASLRAAVATLEAQVARQRRAALTRLLTKGRAIEKARAALRSARRRAQRYDVRGNQWSALRPGFEQVYAEGRERFAVAYKHANSDDMHQWRKRVKDLMAQLRLLHGLWPAVMDAWAADSHALADLLGDHHDLTVLRAIITQDVKDAITARDRDALLAGIDRRRARLAADARPLGRRLYAESPKDVGDRLELYWKAWRLAKREEKAATKPTSSAALKTT
jgi:CHAD domain-containing protein